MITVALGHFLRKSERLARAAIIRVPPAGLAPTLGAVVGRSQARFPLEELEGTFLVEGETADGRRFFAKFGS